MLGGDWHAARITLTVALPATSAWHAGARWFRCDLSETGSIDNTRPVNRTGSLRSAMIGDSPLLPNNSDLPYRAGSIFYPVAAGVAGG
ncbi:septum formation family protein [Micromonospora sp. C31]|uniref:septum formation family protein n=1 Tax=Micromonospora sp. C31 TaxID=2824876 RepID=UPI0027DBF1E4|nr:septum formation family protein [Micromonospora sp. C31]